MMATETDTPRAWVGCLACYNAGHLVGEWVDGTEAEDSVTDAAFALAVHDGIAMDEPISSHEEWWVFDHEGYAGLISGECSPSEAQRLAELLTSADVDDMGAVLAYCSAFGYDLAEVLDDPSGFEESYNGVWDSREDFAQDLAEQLGAIPEDASWPASYIDWERAARDLFMDYSDEPAPGGRIYVFRSL